MTLPDEFSCVTVEWPHVNTLCRILSEKILEDGYMPEVVAAMARGGWIVGRLLCDYFSLADLISIKVEHYVGVAITGDEAIIRYPVASEAVRNKKVILVDDVTDTGESMEMAVACIRELGASDIKTAVLQHKASSTFDPDYYGEWLEEWNWIIYPWEFHEDVANLVSRVLKGDMDTNEIHSALAEEFDLHLSDGDLSQVLQYAERCNKLICENDMWRQS